jgi:hypothetical protein
MLTIQDGNNDCCLLRAADGLRTRMQLGLSARGVGVAALLRQVAAKEGAQALMAGVAPRIAKRTLQVTARRNTRIVRCCQFCARICLAQIQKHSAMSQKLDGSVKWCQKHHLIFCLTLALLCLQTALLWTIYEELRLVFTKLAQDR